jgi:HlyD family secretion protein
MNTPQALNPLLQSDNRPWWRRLTLWLLCLAVAGAGGAAWWWQRRDTAATALRYVTQPVTRGNLAVTVTATGTLQPTRTVGVGSELSGTVSRVLVDVNDRLKKGQLLVELDKAKLADAVRGARADADAARARQRQAEATLKEARAALARLEELARLSGGKLPSAAELDGARASTERADADLAAAVAAVAQAAATLSTSQTNLSKAAIRSPIDGIVLTRNVEPGIAVAASLQAVTLLALAEDLSAMKLQVNVDEADVAQVRPGQRARFSVAAQPGRDYTATVSRVAVGSTTTDNVVTYTTQLDVDNQDLSLRPGMTGTAVISTTERQAVLLVPNSALRFTPGGVTAAGGGSGAAAASGGSSLVSRLMPRPPGAGAPRRGGSNGKEAATRGATIHLLRDGRPIAIKVQRGLSDGRMTEVAGEGLAEGQAVITDQAAAR